MRDASDEWPELRERLRMVVRERGVGVVADDIPLHRATLFRLLAGRTERPAMPTQECIWRVCDAYEMDRGDD